VCAITLKLLANVEKSEALFTTIYRFLDIFKSNSWFNQKRNQSFLCIIMLLTHHLHLQSLCLSLPNTLQQIPNLLSNQGNSSKQLLIS